MQILCLQAEHIRLKDALVHAELETQRLCVLLGRPTKPDVQVKHAVFTPAIINMTDTEEMGFEEFWHYRATEKKSTMLVA